MEEIYLVEDTKSDGYDSQSDKSYGFDSKADVADSKSDKSYGFDSTSEKFYGFDSKADVVKSKGEEIDSKSKVEIIDSKSKVEDIDTETDSNWIEFDSKSEAEYLFSDSYCLFYEQKAIPRGFPHENESVYIYVKDNLVCINGYYKTEKTDSVHISLDIFIAMLETITYNIQNLIYDNLSHNVPSYKLLPEEMYLKPYKAKLFIGTQDGKKYMQGDKNSYLAFTNASTEGKDGKEEKHDIITFQSKIYAETVEYTSFFYNNLINDNLNNDNFNHYNHYNLKNICKGHHDYILFIKLSLQMIMSKDCIVKVHQYLYLFQEKPVMFLEKCNCESEYKLFEEPEYK